MLYCCHVTVVLCVSKVGWGWGNLLTVVSWNEQQRMMNDDHYSSFGCHIADSDVAPGFCVNKRNERGGCDDSPNVNGDDVVCLHC